MSRDLASQTAVRFTQEWSGARAASQLQPEALQALVPRFSSLDPLVQARVLLSACFMQPDKLAACRDALQALAQASRIGDDEWVQVTGRACGGFTGALDLNAVTAESSLVSGTLSELSRLMDAAKPCPDFRPLEELYLSPRAAAARGANSSSRAAEVSHFQLRNPKAAVARSSGAIGFAATAAAAPISLAALNLPDKQAGYSEKLDKSQGAANTSTAATAFGQRTSAPPAPPANASDMFLPARPAFNRSTASSAVERVRGSGSGSGRQTRTKQLPLHEVAAMQQKEARAAKAAAATKAPANISNASSLQRIPASSSAVKQAHAAEGEGEADPESQWQEHSDKSGAKSDSETEAAPMLSLDAYLSSGTATKWTSSRPTSAQAADSAGRTPEPRLAQLQPPWQQQQWQHNSHSHHHTIQADELAYGSQHDWQRDSGHPCPNQVDSRHQVAHSGWQQGCEVEQRGKYHAADQNRQRMQSAANDGGGGANFYVHSAERRQHSPQVAIPVSGQVPSSPESGEVELEQGHLFPASPRAKRQRIDDDNGADSAEI